MKSTTADDFSKGTGKRMRTDIETQDYIIVSLSNSADTIRFNGESTMVELYPFTNNIYNFTDRDQCIDFLTDVGNTKALMVISNKLCQHIVPLIHDITHLHSIFILRKNKNNCEQWVGDWAKIKGTFTDTRSISIALKKAVYQVEQNDIPISFIMPGDDLSNEQLSKLNCSFMYTQIIKEILLTIQFEEKHVKEFLQYYQNNLIDNENTLKNISKLEQEYYNQTPIWWYTSEYFLYSTLNRALRTMDVDVIVKMGFFINDLHRQVQQRYLEQINRHDTGNCFTVYRGQGMSKTDFNKLMKTKGGLMSFNNFLSTSKTQDVSQLFAESNAVSPDSVGILFVMTIDPSKSTIPFATTADVSYFQEEDEIIFSMHTVFRIHDIKAIDENRCLFQVNLTLTSDNDEDLRVLTKYIQEEISPESSGWYRLGLLLRKMGHPEKAQKVFEIMSAQSIHDDSTKAAIYNAIGLSKYEQGKYDEALVLYEKVLVIQQQSLPFNHPDLVVAYNNIGIVYTNMCKYLKALLYYEKALAIDQQIIPLNHQRLPSCYNNIGIVYNKMSNYSAALSYFEKAFAIQQQSLPSNHPDLAMSCSNIAHAYQYMQEHSKAVLFLGKALAIREQFLPPNHPHLSASYSSIGVLYQEMGDYMKAASYLEKALTIQQQSLSPNHPHLALTHYNIGLLHDSMGEYSKAISHYKKALVIQQQSLSPNHSNLINTYNNMGAAYQSMRQYVEALSYFEKTLAMRQQSFPSCHPIIAQSHSNIGFIHFMTGDFSKARLSYECAVSIAQQSLPSNHPDLQRWNIILALLT